MFWKWQTENANESLKKVISVNEYREIDILTQI